MVKMAESFGVAAYRAEGVDEFRVALRDALDANAPALIEVPVPPAAEIGIFPMQQEAPRPVLNL
jgi:thiamine pyrophosphate-dependent acetolactate synthase large subunit-like protein